MRPYLSSIATVVIVSLVGSPLMAVAIPPPPQDQPVIGPDGQEIAPPEHTKSPSRSVIVPTMRLLFGAAGLSKGPGLLDGMNGGFAFDFKLGAVLADDNDSGLILWPELGYSYGGPESRGRNLVTAGLGLHYGDGYSSFGWSPAFVAGSEGDATAYGMRNALGARWYFFSAELAHTYTSVGSGSDQEIRFTVGVDVLWTIVAILFTNAIGRISD